jgi:hypothetical protein
VPDQDSLLNKDLSRLDQSSWKQSSLLDHLKILERNFIRGKFFGEQICGRNGILNGEIYSNTANWRHRMRSVADTQ